MLRSTLIAATILCSAGIAGPTQPLLVRHVVLGQTTGPAYYSVVEKGYRFVGGNESALAAASTEPMAVSSLETSDTVGAAVAP